MIRAQEARLRRAAARRQKLRCHYCEAQMWLTDPTAFLARFDVTLEQASRFQCTAEHLVARRDGGPNVKKNVVAACRHCNVQRHDDDGSALDHEAYRGWVRRQVELGNWHPEWARDKGISGTPA